jgi:hypothetical protein
MQRHFENDGMPNRYLIEVQRYIKSINDKSDHDVNYYQNKAMLLERVQLIFGDNDGFEDGLLKNIVES